MAYERGRFGVEYQPRRAAETHRLRGFLILVVALVLVAFTWYRISRHVPKSAPVEDARETVAPVRPSVETDAVAPSGVARAATTNAVSTSAPRRAVVSKPVERKVVASPPPMRFSESARRAVALAEASSARSEKEKVLLQRWAEAERQGNVELAIDALRKLYERPTMADVRDALMRRLGELNYEHLFSGKTTPWTVIVKAKRGDSRDRIAREHRSTPMIVAKLNPDMKWEKLRPGDSVRVLDFPSPVLVIYKARGYADLSLKNGQFFRRYIITLPAAAASGVYAIAREAGTTVHARLRDLGARITVGDRAELEMFLAPGAHITVAAQ